MTPYASRGVHGQTVEALAHRLLGGEWAEGATLDLVALRGELDVSLTALRESLKVLAAKGLVDARQRRGTFVRPRTQWNLLDPDVLRWRLAAAPADRGADVSLQRDLGEVRAIVEPAAARLAAERRAPDDLAALEESLTAMSRAGSPAEAAAADLAFHRALLTATHNELLVRMEPVFASGLAERDVLVHSSATAADPVPHHRAVLTAVREGDATGAEALMRALLDQAARDLDRATRDLAPAGEHHQPHG